MTPYETLFSGVIHDIAPILVIVLIIIVLLVIYRILFTPRRPEKLPYYINPNFLSRSEKIFFRILKETMGNDYYIFPQIGIENLLKVEKESTDRFSWFNKIKQKSVDFVLADKNTITPILIIELDDPSHKREDRVERDRFVNKAFEDAGLKYLRVPVQNDYQITEIMRQIEEKIIPREPIGTKTTT
jgi:very-short-patch-repair endonuclease